MSAAPNRLHIRHEAAKASAGLPPLLVAAERVAATVVQGVHGRRRVGLGETFWQFRRYEPSDSIRSIDWRQSAKTEHLYIRETEWAAAQTMWLWRDASASMRYRSSRDLPEKLDRADLLLLALASLLVRASERVALLDGAMRPASGSTALDRITAALLAPGDAAANKDAQSGVPAFLPLPRFGHLALFGDFLAPLKETDAIVRRYASSGVSGHLVQVLDPAEESLPFAGRTRFEGLENDGRVLIKRVENVRDDYHRRMRDHQEGLTDIARAVGWSCVTHYTHLPPERTLLSLYVTLTQTPQ